MSVINMCVKCLSVVRSSPTILSFYAIPGVVFVVIVNVVTEVLGFFKLFVIDENW